MTKISTDERRTQILNTATKLFVEKGYFETSVSEIVKQCGIAQGTFYYYFKTKEDIFKEVIYDIPAMLSLKIRGVLDREKTPSDKIRYICNNLTLPNNRIIPFPQSNAELTASNVKIISAFLNNMSRFGSDYLSEILTDGVNSGEFTVENIDFAVMAAIGLLKELFARKYFSDSVPAGDDELKKYMLLFFEKLLNTKL